MNTVPAQTLRSGAAAWMPWLLALAGAVLDVAAFWPGQMSFDSAYTWWQARHGATLGIVPPVFVRMWQACDALAAGPAPVFAVHLALFWAGLAVFVRALRLDARFAAVAVVMVAFTPVPWLLRGHVWTDVALTAALVGASGLLATVQAGGRRGWLLAVVPLLLYAAALRHNAVPAVLPLMAWLGWLGVQPLALRQRRVGFVLATAASLVASLLFGAALDAGVRDRVPAWPMLAQFDLAALSVETEHLLLPPFIVGPGLDVADLAQAFRPWSNLPMLTGTRHGMHAPFEAFRADDLVVLRDAWFAAIAEYPAAWLAHRWRLTRALFGTHAADWPRELLYVDDEAGYRDNPPVGRNATGVHLALMKAAAGIATTLLLAPWPYLLLGACAGPAAWRRRREPAGIAALVLLASSGLYAVSFTVLAVSAELRYLDWPCVACLLGAAGAWLAPRAAPR